MNLLAAVHYDPAVSASKATSALLAMTALDTAALRVTFTVPLSGRVYVRVSGGALHGAATYPSILVGILSGATVIARHQPIITINGAASATTPAQVFCEFVVPGLTPGSAQTWDLAYGVEQLVAATGWKYGGPNNATTAGDAFGGISFTVFDPSPIYLPTVMPTATVQANQSTSLANEATIAGYIDTEVGTIIANQGTLATTVAGVKAKTDTLPATPAAVSDIPTAATVAAAVWAAGTRSLTTFGTLAADVWAVATRTLTAASDSAGVTTLLTRITGAVPLATDYTAARAAKLDNLDVAVSTRGTSTFAGGAVASVTGSVGSVASYGTLVADIATAVWGAVSRTLTASLDPSAASIAAAVWAAATRTITGGTITTYTGNTPQTGDAFARLGAPGGASVAADVAAVKADTASVVTKATDLQSRVPAALVGGRMSSDVQAMGSSVLTASALATDAVLEIADGVWDESLLGHLALGTTGAGLAAASTGGVAVDPWAASLGGYAAGSAGKLLSDRLASPLATGAQVTAAIAPLATSAQVTDVRAVIGEAATGTLTTDIAAIGPAKLPTRRR